MPGWITLTLRQTELDLATYPGYTLETTLVLLAEFDRNVREARAALAATSDADLAANWTLRNGERVFMTMARGPVVRTHINHLVHHRGQLSVYLRLLDVPVPSIYGPTADERI
jgi:uncharacterized damage-inducible protein DinB